MANECFGVKQSDSLVVEHIRAKLLDMLVQAQYEATAQDIEKTLRQLIVHLDDIQMALDISRRQEVLPLEPINLAEVAEQVLHGFSKGSLGDNLKLKAHVKRSVPVLAHRLSLTKSLSSMIEVMTESYKSSNAEHTLEVKASTFGDGVRLGVYSDNFNLEAIELRKFKKNILLSSRPTSQLTTGGIAHLFIASTLADAMGLNFRTAIHQKARGIAMVLPISRQLELILG